MQSNKRPGNTQATEEEWKRICELVVEQCGNKLDSTFELVHAALEFDAKKQGCSSKEFTATRSTAATEDGSDVDPRAVDAFHKIMRLRDRLRQCRKKCKKSEGISEELLREKLVQAETMLKESEKSRVAGLQATDALKKRLDDCSWNLQARMHEVQTIREKQLEDTKKTSDMEESMRRTEENNTRELASARQKYEQSEEACRREQERCRVLTSRAQEENSKLLGQCQLLELKNKQLHEELKKREEQAAAQRQKL